MNIREEETIISNRGNPFTIRYVYPEKNDPLTISTITNGLVYAGVFDGVFMDTIYEHLDPMILRKTKTTDSLT